MLLSTTAWVSVLLVGDSMHEVWWQRMHSHQFAARFLVGRGRRCWKCAVKSLMEYWWHKCVAQHGRFPGASLIRPNMLHFCIFFSASWTLKVNNNFTVQEFLSALEDVACEKSFLESIVWGDSSSMAFPRKTKYVAFLPCGAMHSADWAVARCLSLSVCLLSVCSMSHQVFCQNGYTYETFSPLGSHIICSFPIPNAVAIFRRGLPYGGIECRGYASTSKQDICLTSNRSVAVPTNKIFVSCRSDAVPTNRIFVSRSVAGPANRIFGTFFETECIDSKKAIFIVFNDCMPLSRLSNR